MKNVIDKIETLRTATAFTCIQMAAATVEKLKANDLPKKDVLPMARAAGVLAAKKTAELIPYCHPLPIDGVDIDITVLDTRVEIQATVTTIWKTGVEMEALTAASIAALTVYDMLKPVDKGMEILSTKLLSKKGGKSDYVETLPKDFKAAVIVTSDGTHAGKRQDKSGKIIRRVLEEFGICRIESVVLPDERQDIKNRLLAYCDEGVDLIVTTGGTGLGPRDVTVEATSQVIERDMPAVMQAMRSFGQRRTPYAMLSRGLAGVRGKTVIINLPGSSKGAEEGMAAIFPAVLHVFKMMRGGGH